MTEQEITRIADAMIVQIRFDLASVEHDPMQCFVDARQAFGDLDREITAADIKQIEARVMSILRSQQRRSE
jgi:hypothetical protein